MGVYSHGRLATSQASLVACQLRTKLVRNDIKRQTHQLKLPDDTSHKLRTEMPNEVRNHSKTGPWSVLVATSGSTPVTTGLASRRRTFFFIGCIDCDLRSSVCSYVFFHVSVAKSIC